MNVVLPIADHSARSQRLLVQQFQDSPVLKALVDALVKEVQEVEDALNHLNLERWVGEAEGAQLDGLGAIVGQPRFGQDDDGYRLAVLKAIFVNASDGTPDLLSRAARFINGASEVHYSENYPMKIAILVNGAAVTPELIATMLDLAPVTVGLSIASTGVNPFAFYQQPRLGGGFGTYNTAGTVVVHPTGTPGQIDGKMRSV